MTRTMQKTGLSVYGRLLVGGLALVLLLLGASTIGISKKASAETSSPQILKIGLIDQLDQLGRASFASTYGGVAATQGESHLVIYLTELDTNVESQFESLSSLGAITFVQSPNTLATLHRVQDEITTAIPSLQADGIKVVRWSIDIQSGKVDIYVASPGAVEASVANSLNGQFGSGNIYISNVWGTDIPRAYSNRISDSSLWSSGDSIGSNRGTVENGCSSGFSGSTSAYGSVTLSAAHCFYVNEVTYNEIIDGNNSPPWNPSTGASTFGTAKAQSASGDTGTEVINAAGSGYVWTGPISSPSKTAVTGWASNPVGYDVCTDGGEDGTLGSNSSPSYCGSGTGSDHIQIDDNSTCLGLSRAISTSPYETSVSVCNLVTATSSGSSAAAGQADSGGPVFRFTNSGANLYAVGIIQAGSGSAYTCPYNNNPTRVCQQTVYYSAMSSTISEWSLTLDTN